MMFTSEIGMRYFHAKAWSWSSRKRGNVNRTQKMRKPTSIILANSTSGPTMFMTSSSRSTNGHRPAAEEQRGGDGGEGAGGGELADEEQQEPQAGVLGDVAGDDLGLGHRHVERGLGELGLGGDEEDGEADDLRDDERVADAVEAEDLTLVLGRHDALQVERAGLDHHADDGEHHRQLVGDQLAGRAQATDERVLVGRRPPGDEDADHRHRRQAHGQEDAGVEVGEVGVGAEGHDHEDQERRRQHDVRRQEEQPPVGPVGDDVLLLEELADLGEELDRAVGPGLGRARAGSA